MKFLYTQKSSFAGIPGFRDRFFHTLEWLVVKSIISDHFIFTGITLIMVRSMTAQTCQYSWQNICYTVCDIPVYSMTDMTDWTYIRLYTKEANYYVAVSAGQYK